MNIIINLQLRKLRANLNQKHIKYQDFMLNKAILKVSFSQQIYLISYLQDLNITKEQFYFLLHVFENNNTLFYKITSLIRRGVIFGTKEIALYNENKDIYEILVDMKTDLKILTLMKYLLGLKILKVGKYLKIL